MGGADRTSPKTMGGLLRLLGYCLVGLALLFLFETLWSHWAWIVAWEPKGQIIFVLAWGAMLYGGNCFLLSAAWRQLLIWQGEGRARLAVCHRVYARTPIAKYLPKNVFHYTGRDVVGKQMGLEDGVLAVASLHEIIGVTVASGTIALLGVAFLVLGGIFLAVVQLVSDVRSVKDAGQIITASSLSWIVGYITPDSPAGGVVERGWV